MEFIKKIKRVVFFILDSFPDIYYSIIGIINNLANRNYKAMPITIKTLSQTSSTPVDSYWGEHTVNPKRFKSPYQSLNNLKWRFKVYPLFRELMELYGEHDKEVIVDYGCGPGNDLVGFAVYTNAEKVIGIDVSEKALNFAKQRLELHRVSPERIELINISDSGSSIPLEDNSIDYVYCEGVLQHTSNPDAIIKEFFRILKPSSQACVMVYNYESVWLHLYTAYQRMVLENTFPGSDLLDAFSKNTDGVACPLSRCYKPLEFINVCSAHGFRAEYLGGYLSDIELKTLKKYRTRSLQDERLPEEHKSFIKNLSFDERGFPMYQGKYAGIGGVYKLYKS